jgi:hypothetical protein
VPLAGRFVAVDWLRHVLMSVNYVTGSIEQPEPLTRMSFDPAVAPS